jgi:hypothetical protein
MKLLEHFAPVDPAREGSKFLILLLLSISIFSILRSGSGGAHADSLEVGRKDQTFSAIPVGTPPEQSTAEVCRETKRVYDQYDRDWKELYGTMRFKEREAWWRTQLRELRRAIAGGYVVSGLDNIAAFLWIANPGPSTKNRLAFQSAARDLAESRMQKVQGLEMADLEAQKDRVFEQMNIRERRMQELNCKEVLAREQSSSAKSGCDGFAGTWKTSFGEMTFQVNGNIATSSYDFDGGSVRGELTNGGKTLAGTYSEKEAKGTFRFTLDPDGQSFTGRWQRTSGRREPPSGTWEGKCVQP